MRATLGDLVADLNTIATASDGYGTAGGLGPWLQNQLVAFRALPSAVASLHRQISGASAVLTQAGAGATTAAQQLRDAGQLVDSISTSYPGVSQKVDRLIVALIPVMPQINAGDFNTTVLTALLGSGLDMVQTVYSVNELLSKRDRAQTLIQQAVTDPSLTTEQRDGALAAMGGDTGSLLKIGALLVIGYVIVKAVWK